MLRSLLKNELIRPLLSDLVGSGAAVWFLARGTWSDAGEWRDGETF